jgi:hypothetical protein
MQAAAGQTEAAFFLPRGAEKAQTTTGSGSSCSHQSISAGNEVTLGTHQAKISE